MGFIFLFLWCFMWSPLINLNGRNGSEGRTKSFVFIQRRPPKRASKALHVLKADVTSFEPSGQADVITWKSPGTPLVSKGDLQDDPNRSTSWGDVVEDAHGMSLRDLLLHFVNMEKHRKHKKNIKSNEPGTRRRYSIAMHIHALSIISYHSIPNKSFV